MTRRVAIHLNIANALQLLGSLYRNPADAIKEHVSNALDEHLRAQKMGQGIPVCNVVYTLEKDKITIAYPYGMDRYEFEDALNKVADSVKPSLDVDQIGQLGIGNFSFLQIGKKCTFLSKKTSDSQTLRVTLRSGSSTADFESVPKRDELPHAGLKVIITQLLFDPTKRRGSLSAENLQKVFAEKFDHYLRLGTLVITIICRGSSSTVQPLRIELPPIGLKFKDMHLARDFQKKFRLELYFDPSGKGKLALRHTGVAVVEDVSQLKAYGLEESIYASGNVKGHIEANFLKPLPARTGFEENEDWIALLEELDNIRPFIEEEVEALKQAEMERKLTQIQRKAIEIASDILNMDEFKDLEMLQGLGRKPREARRPPNGFDFVPQSVRANVGERAHLLLKAEVPQRVPDGTLVSISSTTPTIALEQLELTLKEVEARDGVVSSRVYFKGVEKLSTPAEVLAKADSVKAESKAYIMVGDAGPARIQRTAAEEGREGHRFNYSETAFEDGGHKHSRFIGGTVQVNNTNPDYNQEKSGSDQDFLAYVTLMIGKETIAYNDRSNVADTYLEKMLSFYFRLSTILRKGSRGRPRRLQAV
jgi:hypothetical protein